MPTRIEWHLEAAEDLSELDSAVQQRITDAVGRLRQVDDPRQRLIPYVESLSGFWKLRVGDYRVICELRRDGDRFVMIIRVVHRREAYLARNIRLLKRRSED